jgi:Cu2+-exporting ATPase
MPQVDESLVTGETQWRSAGEGEMVHAGTMNMTGALHLRVAKACEGTLLDEIQRLVEAAVTVKAGLCPGRSGGAALLRRSFISPPC